VIALDFKSERYFTMNMEPRIERLQDLKLIGKKVRMSFVGNKTRELWQSFMPKRADIKKTIGSALYSVEIYNDTNFFRDFNPAKEFEKWAAVKVSDFSVIPDGMESLMIPAGDYAVFQYKGKPSAARATYQYIYGNWIPGSEYSLDDRPHFALMGEKYKGEDPDSEEELWIPIKKK
jgi:AraC family transcriptional regulator